MEWLLTHPYVYDQFGLHAVTIEEDEYGSYIEDANGWKNYLSIADNDELSTNLPVPIATAWNYSHLDGDHFNSGHYEIIALIEKRMYRINFIVSDFPKITIGLIAFEDDVWNIKDSDNFLHVKDLVILQEVLIEALKMITEKPRFRLLWVTGNIEIRGGEIICNMLGEYNRYWKLKK
jgi:hypothetical protein